MVPIPMKRMANAAFGKKEERVVPAYQEVTFPEAVKEVIEEFSHLDILKRLADPKQS